MSDPTSGNRWEPTGSSGAPETPVEHHGERTLAPPVPAAAASPQARTPRKKGLLAGMAAAVLFVGGLGGFGLGHALGGDDGEQGPTQVTPFGGQQGGQFQAPPGDDDGPDGDTSDGFDRQPPGQPGQQDASGSTGTTQDGSDT